MGIWPLVGIIWPQNSEKNNFWPFLPILTKNGPKKGEKRAKNVIFWDYEQTWAYDPSLENIILVSNSKHVSFGMKNYLPRGPSFAEHLFRFFLTHNHVCFYCRLIIGWFYSYTLLSFLLYRDPSNLVGRETIKYQTRFEYWNLFMMVDGRMDGLRTVAIVLASSWFRTQLAELLYCRRGVLLICNQTGQL